MGPQSDGDRASGAVAAAAAGGWDRAMRGQDRARRGGRAGGTSDGEFCKKVARIRSRLVARSALSGIAVEGTRSSYSHPLCPCGRRRHCSRGIPLVSGTSVPPLRRSPVLVSQGSVLRIKASRWITRGLPDRSPVYSRGGAVPPLAVSPQLQPGGRCSPLFDMAEHHSMPAHPPAMYPKVRVNGAHPTGGRRAWQGLRGSVRGECVGYGVRGSWRGQPPRWGKRPSGPFPSVGARCGWKWVPDAHSGTLRNTAPGGSVAAVAGGVSCRNATAASTGWRARR